MATGWMQASDSDKDFFVALGAFCVALIVLFVDLRGLSLTAIYSILGGAV
jgi:hypothetical protein